MPTGGSGGGSEGPSTTRWGHRPGAGQAGRRGPVRAPREVGASSGIRRGPTCPTTSWQGGHQGPGMPSQPTPTKAP